MSYLSWNERFSVGIEALDTDHKILLDLINQLHDAYAGGKGAGNLDLVFEVLMTYVERHFQREEALMRRYGYPGLEPHIVTHEELREEVAEFYRAFSEGRDTSVYIALLGFLNNWWHLHILEQDKAYGDYFKSLGVATTVEPGGAPAPFLPADDKDDKPVTP